MGIVKANFPHEWIVVANITTLYSQAINDRERGAFPHIVNVRLVGYAQQQYPRPIHCLARVVQSVGHQLDHVFRHARVHFLSQPDEARIKPILARLPRKVVRIERNAMPAYSWSRIKRPEAERLGG